MKNIPSLTSLRGIASLLVVFYHYHIGHALLAKDIFLIDKFYLMVDLFFVLSGFIMVHVYAQSMMENFSSKTYIKFIKVRIARIYPLHLFSFLVLLCLVLILKQQGLFPEFLNGIFDTKSIPFVVSLTHAWGFILNNTWNIPSWSISVEWFLYLIFPVFLVLIPQQYNKKNIWIFIACIIGLFLLAYVYEPLLASIKNVPSNTLRPLDITTSSYALLRGIIGFGFGMLAYNIFKQNLFYNIFSRSIIFILITLILFLGWYINMLPDPIAIALFPFLMLSAIYSQGILKKILNSKFLTFLGDISYSLYLTHSVLLLINVIFLRKFTVYFNTLTGNNYGGFVVFISATFLLSIITYYTIEKPGRNLLKRM